METASMTCPTCHLLLEQGHRSGLGTWQCPSGHGVLINLVEAYGHLQPDELEAIWTTAQRSSRGGLRSPVDSTPMTEVTISVDDDPRIGAAGGEQRDVTIEVDVKNRLAWFSLDDLRSMPFCPAARDHLDSEVVAMDELDDEAERNDDVFGDLGPDDLGPLPGQEYAGEQRSEGLLQALVRRLRS